MNLEEAMPLMRNGEVLEGRGDKHNGFDTFRIYNDVLEYGGDGNWSEMVWRLFWAPRLEFRRIRKTFGIVEGAEKAGEGLWVTRPGHEGRRLDVNVGGYIYWCGQTTALVTRGLQAQDLSAKDYYVVEPQEKDDA